MAQLEKAWRENVNEEVMKWRSIIIINEAVTSSDNQSWNEKKAEEKAKGYSNVAYQRRVNAIM